MDLGSHCLSELREQGGGPGLSLPIRVSEQRGEPGLSLPIGAK